MKMFTIDELVSYLRSAVEVQKSDSVKDEAFLTMTDDDLQLFLRVAVTNNYSEYSLGRIPEEAVYPVLLLARRELYYKLATISAPLYNLEADGASLSRSNRFGHYMALIKELDSEYEFYTENGGVNGTVQSSNVALSDRYTTRYNQEITPPPVVSLYVDSVADTYVEVSWKCKNLEERFKKYMVYISKDKIFDEYVDKDSQLSSSAVLATTITDKWQTRCRVSGLVSGTTYHVAVLAVNSLNRSGYDEDTFTTAKVTTASDTVSGV